jgi:hypothetical protein
MLAFALVGAVALCTFVVIALNPKMHKSFERGLNGRFKIAWAVNFVLVLASYYVLLRAYGTSAAFYAVAFSNSLWPFLILIEPDAGGAVSVCWTSLTVWVWLVQLVANYPFTVSTYAAAGELLFYHVVIMVFIWWLNEPTRHESHIV